MAKSQPTDTNANRQLGEQLRAGRMQEFPDDTQADFAHRIGVSRATYQKMEDGDPGVALGSYLQAARQLGILDQVIDGYRPPRLSLFERDPGRHTPPNDRTLSRLRTLRDALLQRPDWPSRPAEPTSEALCRGFWEAYFSNYIEGLHFSDTAARDVLEWGRRETGTHSYAACAQLAATQELAAGPLAGVVVEDIRSVCELLEERHFRLMASRPGVAPGRFRDRRVQAAGYVFMEPAEIAPTLEAGLSLLRELDAPLARAIYMHYLIAEIHPFLDGNGRVARLTGNAELTATGEARVLITGRDHQRYLRALRALSSEGDPAPLIAMMDAGQALTAEVDFSSWGVSRSQLHARGCLRPEE